jgi:hypothetical protein
LPDPFGNGGGLFKNQADRKRRSCEACVFFIYDQVCFHILNRKAKVKKNFRLRRRFHWKVPDCKPANPAWPAFPAEQGLAWMHGRFFS